MEARGDILQLGLQDVQQLGGVEVDGDGENGLYDEYAPFLFVHYQ